MIPIRDTNISKLVIITPPFNRTCGILNTLIIQCGKAYKRWCMTPGMNSTFANHNKLYSFNSVNTHTVFIT